MQLLVLNPTFPLHTHAPHLPFQCSRTFSWCLRGQVGLKRCLHKQNSSFIRSQRYHFLSHTPQPLTRSAVLWTRTKDLRLWNEQRKESKIKATFLIMRKWGQKGTAGWWVGNWTPCSFRESVCSRFWSAFSLDRDFSQRKWQQNEPRAFLANKCVCWNIHFNSCLHH